MTRILMYLSIIVSGLITRLVEAFKISQSKFSMVKNVSLGMIKSISGVFKPSSNASQTSFFASTANRDHVSESPSMKNLRSLIVINTLL